MSCSRWSIIRDQLYFFLIKRHLMKYVKTDTTYPTVGNNSDSFVTLLNANYTPNFLKRLNVKKTLESWSETTSNWEYRNKITKVIKWDEKYVETCWGILKKILTDTQDMKCARINKQQWITVQILQKNTTTKKRDNYQYDAQNKNRMLRKVHWKYNRGILKYAKNITLRLSKKNTTTQCIHWKSSYQKMAKLWDRIRYMGEL